MAKRKPRRAELETENEQLRTQVAALQEALISALRLSQQPAPLVKPEPVLWPWQQPGSVTLPGGEIYVGDPPPGQGPVITCQSPISHSATVPVLTLRNMELR